MEELSPQAAPFTLAHGSDDIFWVAHLHAALDEQGFSSGDEEMEAWVFEDQTMSALLTYQVWLALAGITGSPRQLRTYVLPAPGQASRGLEETGVCDPDTWTSLLGPEKVALRLAEAAKLVCDCRGMSAAGSIMINLRKRAA